LLKREGSYALCPGIIGGEIITPLHPLSSRQWARSNEFSQKKPQIKVCAISRARGACVTYTLSRMGATGDRICSCSGHLACRRWGVMGACRKPQTHCFWLFVHASPCDLFSTQYPFSKMRTTWHHLSWSSYNLGRWVFILPWQYCRDVSPIEAVSTPFSMSYLQGVVSPCGYLLGGTTKSSIVPCVLRTWLAAARGFGAVVRAGLP